MVWGALVFGGWGGRVGGEIGFALFGVFAVEL